MNKVFKYELGVEGATTTIKGHFAAILSVQMQGGIPCIWMEVDDEAYEEYELNITAYGTGWDLPKAPLDYYGTIVDNECGLVWHYFGDPFVPVVHMKQDAVDRIMSAMADQMFAQKSEPQLVLPNRDLTMNSNVLNDFVMRH